MENLIQKLIERGYDVTFQYRISKGGPVICHIFDIHNELINFYGNGNNALIAMNEALKQFEIKERLIN